MLQPLETHRYPLAQSYVPRPLINVPLNILLVEDDPSDAMLTEIALEAANLDYSLNTVRDGTEVMPYLQHEGKYAYAPEPDMMVLDLSLPSKHGFEVLAELAADAKPYHDLPIIILTGDTHCAFLKGTYSLNIAAYIIKPCTVEKIRDAMIAVRRQCKH